ncbi:MAG TPA: peptidylprolyl isomerase [Kofleriaceae bacterium]|jgi:peptidyl-prolyl cis-trans isomerase D
MKRIVLAVALVACGPGSPGGPTINNKVSSGLEPTPAPSSSVISSDILAREPVANNVQVKHILIGWKDTDSHDPRDQQRTKAEAETMVKKLLDQLKSGADFDQLMKEDSEDPGSAESGRSYAVSPDAQVVIEFKQLGLRLKVGEIGVVQSDYGFHIMKRVE